MNKLRLNKLRLSFFFTVFLAAFAPKLLAAPTNTSTPKLSIMENTPTTKNSFILLTTSSQTVVGGTTPVTGAKLTVLGNETITGSLTVQGPITSTGTALAVSSITVTNLQVTNINGTATSSTTFTGTTSTVTVRSILDLEGELKTNSLTGSTSGQMLVSQGPNKAPIFQSMGTVFISSFSTFTSSVTTATSFVNTNLTGTFTPKFATSILEIDVLSTCQAATGDSGKLSIKRDSTLLGPAGGLTRTLATNGQENLCGFTVLDKPGAGTFVYTVQFLSGSGANFTFGDSFQSSMNIKEYPQ